MTAHARNIFEQQAANKRSTVLVMIVFAALVGFLGLGFDAAFGDGELFPLLTLCALGVGAFSALYGYSTGARTVLFSSGAQPVPAGDPTYRQLANVMDEMSIASGLPRPALYVIPDPDPNAFATGRSPEDASIAVTQGLVQQLNREELQAVVAHEMSHIRNYDVRLMTVVAALVGSIMLLVEFGLRGMRIGGVRRGGSGKRSGAGGMVFLLVWLVAMILAPVVARILAMAVSRQREYLADASAAELTRNPGALASALEKIAAAIEPTRSIKKGTAHLCIADPIGREINEREDWLATLLATHPPIQKRIALLRAMSYQRGGNIHP
jgi:heat shock protein HtpX